MDNTGNIRGAHFMTNPSETGKRIEVYGSDYSDAVKANEMHFYGDRGDGTIEDLASVGINTSESDTTILKIGSGNVGSTRIAIAALSRNRNAIYGCCYGLSPGIAGVSYGSNAVTGLSFAADGSIYGVRGTGTNGSSGVLGVTTSGFGVRGEATTGYSGYFQGGLGVYISGTCQATTFKVASKRSMKEGITPFNQDALDIVNDTNLFLYTYKEDKEQIPKVGFMADDTHPLMAGVNHDQMDMANTIGVLMKSIQQLSAKVDRLEKEAKNWQLDTKIQAE